MTTTLAQPTSLLERLYAPIADDLRATEEFFRNQMRHEHPFVDELVSHGCLLGGKRLRPALLLLAAQATGRVSEVHHLLGTVVEMIHTATLVHDDVLDEASTRRHIATVNARWDNETAVLLGDYLFSQAFYLASTTGSTTACRLIGEATNRVCAGEIEQKGSRGDWQLSEAAYFRVIEGKTAALTQCSSRLGALFAGADENITARLAEYGRLLGMAFQVADDLLDLLGQPGVVGKTLGTDLVQQKPTLPLIHALRTAPTDTRPALLDLIQGGGGGAEGENRIAALLEWLQRLDSLAYAERTATDFAQRAREQLQPLPESPARETLERMCDFVVSRGH